MRLFLKYYLKGYLSSICLCLVFLLCVGCEKVKQINGNQTSIESKIPSYYYDHILQKENIAETIIEKSNNPSVYAFFTDSHWDNNYKHSPILMYHIVRSLNIQDVVFAGDIINNKVSSIEEALSIGKSFQDSFSFLNGNFFCAFGNHDDNSENQKSKTELKLSDDQVFSFLQSHMTGVTYGPYFNFYFDRDSSHTRFIFLDTGRYYHSNERHNTMSTLAFLANSLLTAKKDDHVVIVSHEWGNYDDSKHECHILPIQDYFLNYFRLMDDYNARRKGVVKYNGEELSYDFSNAESTIEYCIGGHIHLEMFGQSPEGIPIIVLDTDSRRTVPYKTAKKGTISEQCLYIVSCDYSTRKLNIIGVGRGSDYEIDLRH